MSFIHGLKELFGAMNVHNFEHHLLISRSMKEGLIPGEQIKFHPQSDSQNMNKPVMGPRRSTADIIEIAKMKNDYFQSEAVRNRINFNMLFNLK